MVDLDAYSYADIFQTIYKNANLKGVSLSTNGFVTGMVNLNHAGQNFVQDEQN